MCLPLCGDSDEIVQGGLKRKEAVARPEHPLLSGVRPGPLAVRGSPGPTPPPGLVPPLLAFHHQPCAQGWRSLLPPPMAHVPEPSVHPLSCSGPDARTGCPARERPPSTGPASCISDLPQALQRPHYLCTEAASAHFPEEETEAQRLTLLAQAPRPIGAGLGGGGHDVTLCTQAQPPRQTC